MRYEIEKESEIEYGWYLGVITNGGGVECSKRFDPGLWDPSE